MDLPRKIMILPKPMDDEESVSKSSIMRQASMMKAEAMMDAFKSNNVEKLANIIQSLSINDE
jgi:hypothetical protein